MHAFTRVADRHQRDQQRNLPGFEFFFGEVREFSHTEFSAVRCGGEGQALGNLVVCVENRPWCSNAKTNTKTGDAVDE
jgi:hypothetical protein